MEKIEPVINDAFSDIKKEVNSDISLGVPNLLREHSPLTFFILEGLSFNLSFQEDSSNIIFPGAIALILIPSLLKYFDAPLT